MIHLGFYEFAPRRVACRRDLCVTCAAPRLAEGRRFWRVLHLWFIPLAPAGWITRWYCRTCGEETEKGRPSRRGIFFLGAGGGLLIAAIGAALLRHPDEPHGWIMLLSGVALAGVLVFAATRPSATAYTRARAAVEPLDPTVCPLCNQPVLPGTKPTCHSCRVRVDRL